MSTVEFDRTRCVNGTRLAGAKTARIGANFILDSRKFADEIRARSSRPIDATSTGEFDCTPFRYMIWNCGRHQLGCSRTLVMGIVNATPDSFSGDGILGAAAIERARQMISDGADILDIGGESTRPGAAEVSVEEEIRRVIPLVEGLASLNVPLSVDTTKSAVARAALEAGATIINDVSGATADPEMLGLLSRSRCGFIIMHRRQNSQTMRASQAPLDAKNLENELREFFEERLQACDAMEISRARLCLDAGFGFGKSVEENLKIVRRGRELLPFDLPILSAISRKSTIGKILDNAPVEERVFGTAALSALAIQSGANILRVHDVRAMRDVARACDAVLHKQSTVEFDRTPSFSVKSSRG